MKGDTRCGGASALCPIHGNIFADLVLIEIDKYVAIIRRAFD